NSDLFWKNFVGQDQNGSFITGRCGWTHMPPNTTTNYDYQNMTLVNSDIEDWTPQGTGHTKMVNANTWGNIPYPWPGVLPPQRIESQWYIYWMQNMPGRGNTIPYNATNQMRNWWPFTADWDAAINAGLGLHGPYCSFPLSTNGQLFPPGGGSGTVRVEAATGCISISTSNAPWITITSGSGGNGSRVTSYSVAANIGPARHGTIAIGDQVFTVTQQA